MADIDENLITYVVADATVAAITTTFAIGYVPDGDETPYIWAEVVEEVDDMDLGGTAGRSSTRFTIEACSDDTDEAKDLGKAIKARLDGYRGTFGTAFAQGCFVETKDDDYLPINESDDNDIAVVALGLLVIHAGD